MEKLNFIKLILCYSLPIIIFSSTWTLSQNSLPGLKNVTDREKEIHSYTNIQNGNEKDSSSATKELIRNLKVNKFVNVKSPRIIEEAKNYVRETPFIKFSDEVKVEVNLASGEQLTQAFTIQNSGKSNLFWKVASEGSDKLLYRLYVKDRFLSELKIVGKENSNNVITSDEFKAKKLALKLHDSKKNNFVSEISPVKIIHKKQEEQNNTGNISSALFSNNTALSEHKEVNETETAKGQPDFSNDESDSYSAGLSENITYSSHDGVSEDKGTEVNLRDQVKVFQQWYHFADCGYPTFDPHTDVWEVSQDNGEHWQQIFSINNDSYVVNAECFNPIEFLENHSNVDNRTLYSDLTSLDEYVDQFEQGPSFFPKSGTITANTTSNIKIEVDATSVENGTYNPKLMLIDAESGQVIKVIDLSFNVKPESEKKVFNKPDKQTSPREIPDKYELFQNYPNPFNPSTTIKYSLLHAGLITLIVYDVLGNEISRLVNKEEPAGYYEIKFNASSFANGVYFYRLQAGDYVETKKMILLK